MLCNDRVSLGLALLRDVMLVAERASFVVVYEARRPIMVPREFTHASAQRGKPHCCCLSSRSDTVAENPPFMIQLLTNEVHDVSSAF